MSRTNRWSFSPGNNPLDCPPDEAVAWFRTLHLGDDGARLRWPRLPRLSQDTQRQCLGVSRRAALTTRLIGFLPEEEHRDALRPEYERQPFLESSPNDGVDGCAGRPAGGKR